jgi:DedD protein
MKLVIDEKLKHRLIGLAVIISLVAIFAPAIMKKSSQRLENNLSVTIKLPTKPLAPNVVLTDEKELFKTIKIAKVNIPAVTEKDQLPELAKAEIIHSDALQEDKVQEIAQADIKSNEKPIKIALNQVVKHSAKNAIKVAVNKPIASHAPVIALKSKTVKKNIKLVAKSKPVPKADVYAVQLASFSQLTNAQTLVNKLRHKGYKATFAKVPGKQGPVYKVFAGHSPRKVEVLKLKNQLASAMQLNGFIVNTGVS